ncbi:MAG: hypothetical protein ACRD8W_01555 [Nitrososphaeraceae archaeon]
MPYWNISLPLLGRVPSNLKSIYLFDVLFHIHDDKYLNKKQLFATTVLEGDDYHYLLDKATIMIDEALSGLYFISGLRLSFKEEDIRVKQSNREGRPSESVEIGSTPFIYKDLELWYNIGDTTELISKIEQIRSGDKQSVLASALAHYRIAVSSINPFQAIENLFSCISVIARDKNQITNPNENTGTIHLKKALKPIVGEAEDIFNEKFGKFYGERSAGTHGRVNILDPAAVTQVRKHVKEVNSWCDRLLIAFIHENTN